MVGEVEPLKKLQYKRNKTVIKRIVNEYPGYILRRGDTFYRLRKSPKSPHNHAEYDSPPVDMGGCGRFNCSDFPVLYASTDLEVCVHECRFSASDDIYMATLTPDSFIRLLDLSAILDDDETEFESLDMAIHMLFLAGEKSYRICQQIALAAKLAGFDGLIYPSYYSLIRAGIMPLQTAYGISIRRFRGAKNYNEASAIKNVALFGRPIEDRTVLVKCINRLVIAQVKYGFIFGPV